MFVVFRMRATLRLGFTSDVSLQSQAVSVTRNAPAFVSNDCINV
jgi:hypothetical protein